MNKKELCVNGFALVGGIVRLYCILVECIAGCDRIGSVVCLKVNVSAVLGE